MTSPKADIPARVSAIESDLRALAAFAAKEGAWPVVRAASLAAEQLGEVMKPYSSPQPAGEVTPRPTLIRKPNTTKQKRRRSLKSSAYPRFESSGGDLVKVGWSRSEKAEYRHRAPESAVYLVAKAISRLAKESGGGFTSDDLFPVLDPHDGSDVPTYQGYLVLRWFREMGLVEPNGRSEYLVPDAPGLPNAASQAWKDLSGKEKA